MKTIFLMFFAIIFYSTSSQATFIAVNNSKINPDLPTHLLVAGYPDKLGELFIYSLLTKAKIYLEKSPNEQIIIIGRNDDKSMIEDAGFKIIDTKIGQLKPDHIKGAIKNIKSLSSVDIYAHSNAMSGASLDSNSWLTQLLNEKDDLWDAVKEKINSSSFVFIHGCNAGIKFAPAIAEKLKIAVFAALTSTDFQYIYEDAFWSFDYNTEALKKSSKNNFNFSKPKSCGNYCTRMKPDNSPYKGHWGDWSAGGYPTFKLFCGSNENTNCEKGAVEAIASFPAKQKINDVKSNLERFKDQLIDFMCPFAHNADKQTTCKTSLETSLLNSDSNTYSPFRGKTLSCDRVKCKAHFKCSVVNAALNPGACTLVSESDEVSTSFVDDYRFFVNSFSKNYAK